MADPILRVRGEDGKITEIYSYKGDPGNDGVSITNAYINDDNELILELSEGQPINLGVVVGTDGVDGKDGANGENGNDGYTPIKGVDYNDGVGISSIELTSESLVSSGVNTITITLTDGSSFAFNVYNGSSGKNGSNGADGTSCTHSWNGTTLTVTSASGTSSANLKGDTGSNGVGISSVSYSNKAWRFKKTDGTTTSVTLPTIADPDNYYTASEIDAMFNEYVAEVASLVAKTYSVSLSYNSLQGDGITMSNALKAVFAGDPYVNEVNVIDADCKYQILMGATDITNTVSSIDGTNLSVNIPEVSGDIEIIIEYNSPIL